MKLWLGFILLFSSFLAAAELPLVQKQQLELESFTTQSGVVLKQVKVGWEAYGQLNADKSNVILITHFFSGTSHAAGKYRSTDAAAGYWDSIIGPGKAIDTNTFYVVSVDSLANLNAFSPDVITTGPASINPDTGKAYGLSFPVVTIRDFVEVQKALLDKLGIEKLYAVIGPSMGSFQAIEWAVSYPDKVERLLPVIGTAYIDSFSAVRLERWAQPIKQDPKWHKGAYPLTEQPQGLTRALAYVMQDALHPDLFNQSYPAPALDKAIHQDIQAELPAWDQLIKAATQRSAQMDANSLLYLVRASQLWRAGMGDNWQQKLKTVKAKTLWLPATGDLLLTPAMAKQSKAQMPDALYEEISGQAGHLDGLLNIQSKAEQIRSFLAD
ncbi:homoserine O-acetyltransferase [Rheinheimera sediminis]|uniref:E22 family MetX-like putative esterase n=1 Tax=Rheinheimera sp. YQF-1 TaxID=2499626 RepID=UPI000FDA9E1A|nr:homoserine O-acetyltransferase [Rheinheimera sp. YQF-1]RVT47781.1 homoserine O-acetyltransferase [Rheinheimera sp. YQF-1]